MTKANRNYGKCKYSKAKTWQTHESLRSLIIGDQAGLSFIPNFKFTKESILFEIWMDSNIFLLKLILFSLKLKDICFFEFEILPHICKKKPIVKISYLQEIKSSRDIL